MQHLVRDDGGAIVSFLANYVWASPAFSQQAFRYCITDDDTHTVEW